jgi:hypothetical protein
MSIGPLTYFENWINSLNPNIHWVARYLPEELDQEKKLSKAKNILKNSQEFLSKSARKHVANQNCHAVWSKKNRDSGCLDCIFGIQFFWDKTIPKTAEFSCSELHSS